MTLIEGNAGWIFECTFVGVMSDIQEIDQRLLLFLNGVNSDTLDIFMMTVTKILTWLPLYAWLVFALFKHYRKDAWYLLLSAALVIAIADQVTSSFMKPYFQRLRPSHDPDVAPYLHLVRDFDGTLYRGGLYGFASGHAAVTFAVAVFSWLLLRGASQWWALL
ncbi:MAG: phosphatase PAP2 family protein, partial [Cyclobacteriaceae bacterium]|nr:phosphatase PAP2 family protein [Cyclobacteriaceae bacterium]